MKFMDLKAQIQDCETEIYAKIKSVINTSSYIGGDELKDFEQNFVNFIGMKFGLGVGNGTDALEIAISSLGLPPGSRIIVPANSFVASAEAVVNMGHEIVWIDCADDHLIDYSQVRSLVNKYEVRAIIAVNLYGKLVDISKLRSEIDDSAVSIIEDCAQSSGATRKNYENQEVGDIQCFSFYPGKNLGAFGDGGFIATNTQKNYDNCKLISNHGRLKKYDHQMIGRNSRLDNIQAAILDVKLGFLPSWIEARRNVANMFYTLLQNELCLPAVFHDDYHVFHLFVIRPDNRENTKLRLTDNNIPYGVHYPKSLSEYNYLKGLNSFETERSRVFASRIVSIPCHESLLKVDIEAIAKALK